MNITDEDIDALAQKAVPAVLERVRETAYQRFKCALSNLDFEGCSDRDAVVVHYKVSLKVNLGVLERTKGNVKGFDWVDDDSDVYRIDDEVA